MYEAEINISVEKLKELLLEHFNKSTGLELNKVEFRIYEGDDGQKLDTVRIYKENRDW